MLFSDVYGQGQAKSALLTMVQSERIPHAVILQGVPGSGDLALALAFAQYVLCRNRQPDESCGTCSSCKKASKLIHPDLHFSFPVVGTGTSDPFLGQWREALLEDLYLTYSDWLGRFDAGNKQGNIYKDECLQVIRKLSLKPFESEYKVLILWLPELLGKEGNRLLKLIEEPPEKTLLIFVTQSIENILLTIVSRCQLVRVPRLSDSLVAQVLCEKNGLSTAAAASLAYLADGNLSEALKMADRHDATISDLFINWLRRCYRGNGPEMVSSVEAINTLGRDGQKQFFQFGLHFLRELLLLRSQVHSHKVRLLPEEETPARQLAAILPFEQIGALTDLLNECAYFVERNANLRLLFLDASIQINDLFHQRALQTN